ncbi:hypothetical protein ABT104_21500 [Streptomyces mobaraensis]|uniref:hypothetical protein n=1 Tax=Streptomyces mobaraensis TaxID=35621 RepID=UPI00331E7E8B
MAVSPLFRLGALTFSPTTDNGPAPTTGRREDEVVLRQLFAPEPLPAPVVWSDCRIPDVADHRPLVGTPVACRADAPHEQVRAFHGPRRRRLVLLGPAGSGKTTVAPCRCSHYYGPAPPATPCRCSAPCPPSPPAGETFLADAHRRLGILRRVGPVYQFRHVRLLQHLADRAPLPRPRGPARPTRAAP